MMKDWMSRAWHSLAGRRDVAEASLAGKAEEAGHNTGMVSLYGNAAKLREKTVIVLGAARGGTSMVAGAIAHLGIYMGQTRTAVFEDHELSEAIRKHDHGKAARIAVERNAAYSVWGFKKPKLLLSSKWHRIFREPVYVAVFRDPVATAARLTIVHNSDVIANAESVLQKQAEMLAFLQRSGRPCLLVSYEKALLDPEAFIAGLAAFLGCEDADDSFAKSAAFVAPSPDTYRRFSRSHTPRPHAIGSLLGNLERVGPQEAVGWAFKRQADAPVTVELYVNGVLRGSCLADLSRQDVSQQYGQASDLCGFIFRNEGALVWRGGDQLAVRIAGESSDLHNSPQDCRI